MKGWSYESRVPGHLSTGIESSVQEVYFSVTFLLNTDPQQGFLVNPGTDPGLIIKNCKILPVKSSHFSFYWSKNCNLFLPRPPRRTSKLRRSSQFFIYVHRLQTIFAFQNPDPHSPSGTRIRSHTVQVEHGSEPHIGQVEPRSGAT